MLIALWVAFSSAIACVAAEYRLYDQNGLPAQDFNRIIQVAGAGDYLDMGNDQRFYLVSRLGHGNTTMVFALRGQRALRVPLRRGVFRSSNDYVDYVRWYYEGYQELAGSDLPIVRVYGAQSDPSRYLIVDRRNVQFTLADWVDGKVT